MSTPNQPLIQLDEITKVFLTDAVETHALSEIHFEIKHGEYVAIGGPSGCGKSTLLSILGLLDSPTSGSYLLRGEPVEGLGHAERARVRNREIGFIFQSFNLIGDLTVWENVELPLTYRGLNADERHERVEDALAKVEMTARAKHYPVQLSGGQQQRVAVARARLVVARRSCSPMNRPETSIRRMATPSWHCCANCTPKAATICLVTHDERYARDAQRTIRLFDGQLANEEAAAAR
jgi:putative ABC transport system ATP-binding protein